MPLFVIHLLMWLLKSGDLHTVVFTSFLLFSCMAFFITTLNFCMIWLMCILNNIGERPHPSYSFVYVYWFRYTINLILNFVFL